MHAWNKRLWASFMALVLFMSSFAQVAAVQDSYDGCGNGGGVSESGATYFVDCDNWGGPNATVADGDLDIGLKNQDGDTPDNYSRFPVEFKFDVTRKPVTNAYLLIRGYDVDELTGEWDRVYFSSNPEDIQLGGPYTVWPNEYVTEAKQESSIGSDGSGYLLEMNEDALIGTLSGQNNKWNTTVLPLDISTIEIGEYYAGVTIHQNPNIPYTNDGGVLNTNWQMTLDWAQLVIDGGSRVSGEIQGADLTEVEGAAAVSADILAKTSGDFAVEISLIEKADPLDPEDVDTSIAIYQQELNNKTAGETIKLNQIVFKDIKGNNVSMDPNKEYVLNIILYENGEATKESPTDVGDIAIEIDPLGVQHVYTLSSSDPKVSNIELTGKQYEPTDFNLTDFENHFSKINGATDNTLQKVKIVTLPASGNLMLASDGGPVEVEAGMEISADDIRSLQFIPDPDTGLKEPVSFKWNGYDPVKGQYAQFDATVTIQPNLAPTLRDVQVSANKGVAAVSVGDQLLNAYTDPESNSLAEVVLTQVPATGYLEYKEDGSGEVKAAADGAILSLTELATLTYVPADEEQTGPVTFTWNVSDGLQSAKQPGSATIHINTPPVALNIAKPGLDGKPVVIPASAFQIEDPDGDALDEIRIHNLGGLPGTLQYNTVTDATYRPITGSLDADELRSLIFTPEPNLDVLTPIVIGWKAFDGKQESENTAKITITYDGRPTASPQSIEMEEGTPSISIILIGEDAEDMDLQYNIIGQPANGTLKPLVPGGSEWIYSPNSDFLGGTDSFLFTVTDHVYEQVSEPAQVQIILHRALDGWVGEQQQGDNIAVTGIPGKVLKLSAVSSLQAQDLIAEVNGIPVPLMEVDADLASARGYKLWAKTDYILPLTTQADDYTVRFKASHGQETKLEDNHFTVVGTSLSVSANPDKIPGDGKATTQLTAYVKDGKGNPVEGVEVVFTAPSGQGEFVGPSKVVTDSEGKAVVTYKAPTITGTNHQTIDVTVTVDDAAKGLYGEDEITLTFQPATIQGIITKGDTNVPVSGATVRVTLDLDGNRVIDENDFDETVVTDENGAYSLPVPKGDATYDLEVTQNVLIGGVQTPITYKQKAEVGDVAGTGNEVVDSEETVTGLVLFKKPDGQSSLFSNDILSKTRVYLKDSAGNYLVEDGKPKAFNVQDKGVFHADGLTVGTYELEIRYEFEPGKELTINRNTVNVKSNGEMNITQELVDPYGTITDAVTGEPIEDAQVTLYYAGTDRNEGKGIVPNTEVSLPELVGFAPNHNASPQQFSDEHGFYAYMVYPETDYYLVVTKSGYQTYTSPTLHVEWDIVRHDLELSPVRTAVTPPSLSELALNLSIDKNIVQEGEQSSIRIDYKNDTYVNLRTGHIVITLPEGVQVVDAGEGVVDGQTVTWQVADVAAGESGFYDLIVKWPSLDAKEAGFDVRGEFISDSHANGTLQAKSGVKVQVFSIRFDHLQHQRYIIGYPDGEFKPNNHLIRAELAAIIARLTENSELEDELAYSDVSESYWAANYIKIVTKHGYFSGFEDGTFRSNEAITRGELAAVMARFLELNTSKSSEPHFIDTEGHWAGDAIEALYRGKFLAGYADGTFKPNEHILRSEAVTLINRMLFRGPLQGLEPLFPDVSEDHWAFGDIQEATISHEAVRNSDGSETWLNNIEDDVR